MRSCYTIPSPTTVSVVTGSFLISPPPPSIWFPSFPLRADGDGQRNSGSGNGNGDTDAQRYDLPLMKSSAFFGDDDLGGVALEDTGATTLSSSVPGNLHSLHNHRHHHGGGGGGAFSTGASPSRGGGGVNGTASSPPGPVDGSSLAAGLQNQLSF